MQQTLIALLYAAVYTAIIALLGIGFVNYLWPIMPGWVKLIGFILLAFFALGPPYIWLIKRSDKILAELKKPPENK